MSQPVLVKVYGNFSPMDKKFFLALQKSCTLAMPLDPANSPIILKGELCLLSFEGIYFPIDDFVELIRKNQTAQMTGKLDYLDLENWHMTRYLLKQGEISENTVSLNHVLDYSGF